MFTSRYKGKKYCGLSCYVASDQMKEMLLRNRLKCESAESRAKQVATMKKGKDVDCLECGASFYQKRENATRNAKKFCRLTCYRAYLAKRFDRWIANPEEMALPQNYDEFLEKENLPCLINGCGWTGRHLSVHANQAHGIKSDELKRATGFNLSSGLVCKSLAELLQDRPRQGVALDSNPWFGKMSAALEKYNTDRSVSNYKSQEAKEHRAKALAFRGPGPMRVCVGCGHSFVQSTPCGRALYCAISCRETAYKIAKGRVGPNPKRTRASNGVFSISP